MIKILRKDFIRQKKKKKKSPSFECPCFARSPGMSSAHVGHVGISIDHSRAFFTHAPACWSLYILSSLHQEDHRCTSLAMLELMTNDAYLSLGWGSGGRSLGIRSISWEITYWVRSSCQDSPSRERKEWDGDCPSGLGQSEGSVTGASADQNCTLYPAVYWTGKSPGAVEGVQKPGGWSELSFPPPPTPPPGANLEVRLLPVRLGLNPLPLTNCMSLAEPLWALVLLSGKWGFILPKIVVIVKTQYKMVRIVPDTLWVFNKCYHYYSHQYYYSPYFYWSWTLVFFICGGGGLSGNNVYFMGLFSSVQ